VTLARWTLCAYVLSLWVPCGTLPTPVAVARDEAPYALAMATSVISAKTLRVLILALPC
jgi:hypothetical protein